MTRLFGIANLWTTPCKFLPRASKRACVRTQRGHESVHCTAPERIVGAPQRCSGAGSKIRHDQRFCAFAPCPSPRLHHTFLLGRAGRNRCPAAWHPGTPLLRIAPVMVSTGQLDRRTSLILRCIRAHTQESRQLRFGVAAKCKGTQPLGPSSAGVSGSRPAPTGSTHTLVIRLRLAVAYEVVHDGIVGMRPRAGFMRSKVVLPSPLRTWFGSS